MFWENYSKLCKSKGESPNGVAKKLSIASGTVTEWKNGNRTPQNATLKKIADYFCVSVDYLLGKEEVQTLDQQLDGIDFALYGATKDLTDEQKQDVINFANFIKTKKKGS